MSLLLDRMLLADVPPGLGYASSFEYCVNVTNLDSYPNHWVFAQVGSVNTPPTEKFYTLAAAGECIPMRGYRPVVTFFAVPKERLKPSDITVDQEGRAVLAAPPLTLPSGWIEGTPTVVRPDALPMFYSGRHVQDNYKIQTLSPESFELSFVERSPQVLNLLIVPLLGLLIIGGLIWWKRTRSQRLTAVNSNHR